MNDFRIRSALAARYDGPLPPGAAVAADCDMAWRDQLANRKRWAWAEVRRLGHLMVAARRAFHATGALAHHREWVRLRNRLDHPLRSWACYRDWLRAADRH